MKIGLCYRDFIHEEWIDEIFPNIDFIEIMPDITSIETMNRLIDLSEKHEVEIGFHSLKSSLGSPEGVHVPSIDRYYYQYKYCKAKYFSDHVAFSHIQGKYLSTVKAIPYTKKSIDVLTENLKFMQKVYTDLILLENITQDKIEETNQFTEGEFFSNLMKNTDDKIKVMFDVTNAYVTAYNSGISFEKYISDFPFDDVVCIHVSGYEISSDEKLRDSHSANFDHKIIDALRMVLQKCEPEFLLLERDFGANSLNDTLVDIEKLKEVAAEFVTV